MSDKPFKYSHNKRDDESDDSLVKSVALIIIILCLGVGMAFVAVLIGIAKWIWGL